jgi:hypothetical protein
VDGNRFPGSEIADLEYPLAAAAGLRTVRITGTAYASSVEICVKGPDEGMLRRLRKMNLKRTLAAGEYSE